MADITTIEALEAAITARIVALSATAWAQGTLANSWKESAQALDPESAPNPRAHLCFSAWADSVPTEEYPGGCVMGSPTIVVRFLYRLRAGAQPTDMRKATSAAQQIVDALRTGFDGVRMTITDSGRKTPGPGGWAVVDVSFDGYMALVAA